MRVWIPVDGGVTAPAGFAAAGVSAGIKKAPKKDVGLLVSEGECAAAAVFTTNRLAAAPIIVSRKHLAEGRVRAVVANSGNANACTGERGIQDAISMARSAAAELGIEPHQVLVASTGVIGQSLDVNAVQLGIHEAAQELGAGSRHLAEAVMTTDTFPKEIAIELSIGGSPVRVAGVAKGSGMIQPDMATMLAFLTTDVLVGAEHLQEMLRHAVDSSFNMLTVDGQTSTNDMVSVLASGRSEIAMEAASDDAAVFGAALDFVCMELAKMIARDGEGATKLVEVRVTGARDADEAKTAALSVANSPLVKTALFASDPNWGRIAQAVGACRIDVDRGRFRITFGDIVVFCRGDRDLFDEEGAAQYLKGNEVVLGIDLGVGDAEASVWTCDFSYDYVKINAEYRT